MAAQWISELGVEAVAERVSVTCGAQHAMVVVFATLTRPGDLVMTEAVTYPGMKALAALLNLGLEGLALDDEGVRPDAFEAACRSGRSEILYTVPTIQNPTGVVMSPERREALAAIARRHGITIVEDDVHARLPSGKVKPLAAYAPERTYYIASTSKSLAPGLRVGYLLAPDGADEARLGASLWSTTWMAPPLMVEVASRWISDGTAERIVASRRAEAAARQRLAAERLAPYRRSAHPEGYHLWLQVPEPWAADDFAVRARARGVNVNPPAVFAVGRDAAPHAVRLCLGAPRQREELDGALVTVAELLAAGPGAGAFVV